MADSDDLDLDDGDVPESSGAAKKKGGGGLGNLLPTLLKFVAIGLGAVIFIVTVVIITVNFMNRGGANQTRGVHDIASPYLGVLPQYNYIDLDRIQVRTSDFPAPATVSVLVQIGVDQNDQNASMEVISRRHEIHDFLRRYFSMKTAAQLTPQREDEIKREIREMLNTRFLDTARARNILFKELNVMESF